MTQLLHVNGLKTLGVANLRQVVSWWLGSAEAGIPDRGGWRSGVSNLMTEFDPRDW